MYTQEIKGAVDLRRDTLNQFLPRPDLKYRRLSALMSTATNESTQSEKERMMRTCMDYVTREICQSIYCTDDDGFDDVNGKLSCRSGGAKGMNIGA